MRKRAPLKRKKAKPAAVVPPVSAYPFMEYDPLLVGYVRVSTEDQTADMQIHALVRAGVHPENIHQDHGVSGAAAVKSGREMAIRQLRPGMTLVVWKLDRVSRNLLDLLHLLQDMERKDIGLRSLNESLDTKTPMGKVMLAVLGAFAQFERDTATQRTIAGIARAKERGVRFGQPTKITPEVTEKVDRWLAEGDVSFPEMAKRLKLAESTLRKYWCGERLEAARAAKPKRK